VSETGPRVFLSAVAGFSLSLMSLSMDFVAKIWRGRVGSSSACRGSQKAGLIVRREKLVTGQVFCGSVMRGARALGAVCARCRSRTAAIRLDRN
jgi:hypothetical protein